MCNIERLHRLTYFMSILDSCAGDRLRVCTSTVMRQLMPLGEFEYTAQRLMQDV
jgi:hypothetical protein